MTTDNRTSEPTPEQVEAAAKAMHGTGNPWFAAYGDWGAAGFEIKKAFRESARAALVAAQGAGVAPQEPCPQPCECLSAEDAREGRDCREHPCTCLTAPSSDREKLIEEARAVAGPKSLYAHTSVAHLLTRLADALVAATRVPVQGEPNDDREALADRLARALDGNGGDDLGLAQGEGALHLALDFPIREAIEDVYADCGDSAAGVLSTNIAQRLAYLLPTALLAAFPSLSRVTVPDAAPDGQVIIPIARIQELREAKDAATERVAELEAELASRIEDRDYWYGIADKAKDQRDAANEDRKQAEAEIRDLLKVDIPSLKAERNAATTAIAEVRALHRREPGTGVDWCSHCIDNDGPWPCSTIAALDGAPEPEWEEVVQYGNLTSAGFLQEISGRNYAMHKRVVRFGPVLPAQGESDD